MAGLQALSLAALKARIERLENRPALSSAPALLADKPADLLAVPPGIVEEIYADERRDAGTAFGFALGQIRALLTAPRPAFIVLSLANEGQDIGLPYGAGIAHFGLPPDAMVIGRIETLTELLWALEEAIACRAVAAVIADVAGTPKALDFTASRRLSLRAAASGAAVFLLRYGHEREATAAQLRWHIAPEPSAPQVFDERSPGAPRIRATLEKGRHAREAISLLLDWTGHGFAVVDAGARDAAAKAPSRALPAALGYRLSQTG